MNAETPGQGSKIQFTQATDNSGVRPMVSFYWDGRVELGEGVTIDEAVDEFRALLVRELGEPQATT